MSDLETLPRFSSEAEEADWWFKNREKHAEEYLKAVAEGHEKRGGLARRAATAQGFTALDLDTEDISRARTLADQQGLEVASYLKKLVHEALEREISRAA